MSPIPPPPKVNPSAIKLGEEALRAMNRVAPGQLQMDSEGKIVAMPLDRRDIKVPAGMKKIYHTAPPHQGRKEMARRAKQLQRSKK